MADSRYDKYKKLREGIKEGAGLNRELGEEEYQVEDDDFLSFMKKSKHTSEPTIDLDDTLTEAKTYEQMQEESSKEIDKALRSAKEVVGKEAQYNTRMDILNKIREGENKTPFYPQKEVNKIEEVIEDNIEEVVEPIEEVNEEKPEISLMERLEQISKQQDKIGIVKTDIKVYGEDLSPEKIKKYEEENEVTKFIKNTGSLNEIVNEIDQRNNKSVEKKGNLVEKVLNGLIIILIIIFVVLCVLIAQQVYFS